ncbi:MAG: hypothetical protein ACRBBQ_16490 [Cognatishimia sp.]
MRFVLILCCFLGIAPTVQSDPAVIKNVEATNDGPTWTFAVTLQHPDTGWDHYANGWRVLSMAGEVLGTRVLAHPHVDEQPFTRLLSGVELPAGTTQVQIQSSCVVDGWSNAPLIMTLEN